MARTGPAARGGGAQAAGGKCGVGEVTGVRPEPEAGPGCEVAGVRPEPEAGPGCEVAGVRPKPEAGPGCRAPTWCLVRVPVRRLELRIRVGGRLLRHGCGRWLLRCGRLRRR